MKEMRLSIKHCKTCNIRSKLLSVSLAGANMVGEFYLHTSSMYPQTQLGIPKAKSTTLCSASAENKAGCNLFSAAKTHLISMSLRSIVRGSECCLSILA